MAPPPHALFDRYASLPDPSDRIDFAFQAPRLLSAETVRGLIGRVPQSDEAASRWGRLVELDQLRHQLALNPRRYRIGPGPIEQLVAHGHPPTDIIRRCGTGNVQALLSPMYLKCLADHGVRLAQSDDWETGVWLSGYAAEAALAWAPAAPIDPTVAEAVLAHLHAVLFAVLHALDETVFGHAVARAMRMVDRAERQGDRATLGRLCQTIGALFSDIWSVPGRPGDAEPVDITAWLGRPRRQPGLFAELGPASAVPEPAESLRTAVAWYQRALPYRRGFDSGLTYKAIAQTLHFLNGVLEQPIDEALLERCLVQSRELLVKHPQAEAHLQVVETIARDRGIRLRWRQARLSRQDRALLDAVRTHTSGGDASGAAARRETHDEAVRDLERVLRHALPFALYLRNFDHANEIRMVGDVITETSPDGAVSVVVPQITYSLVDHKILQLFEEGVIGVCDPGFTEAHRQTLIPMLSLTDEGWLDVVLHLIRRCTRIVMLMDALTPGVRQELDALRNADATGRTLIVTGHAFRTGAATLPVEITQRFPHVVDWIDFGWDERYHAHRYKAHRVVQDHLQRFVRADARPTVSAWMHGGA